MGLLKKILIGTGITAVVAGGITYVRRLNRLANELEVVPTIKVHKVSLTGITLRLDVKLKNPTNAKVKIKFPFVKLIYKDLTIGSSQSVDKDIEIAKYSEAVAEAIMIDIPLMGVFSVAGDIIKAINEKQPIKLTVRTLTTINLGWKKIPYEDKQEITLKN